MGRRTGAGFSGTVYEQALLSLRPKVRPRFPKTRSFRRGARRPDSLVLTFLNEPFTITKEQVRDASGKEPRPGSRSSSATISACLAPPLSGEWITFSAVPPRTRRTRRGPAMWRRDRESLLGNIAELKAACERCGGEKAEVKGNHDAAYGSVSFPATRAAALLRRHSGGGFPAQCKLLLDRNAPRYST